MESKEHKKSRFRDGGLNSHNCKCGRSWYARQIPGGRGCVYDRICCRCRKKTKNCVCKQL